MISKKIDHAFIMAAGRGTRLMPLTQKIPKGLIKYKQSSLISNGIDKPVYPGIFSIRYILFGRCRPKCK